MFSVAVVAICPRTFEFTFFSEAFKQKSCTILDHTVGRVGRDLLKGSADMNLLCPKLLTSGGGLAGRSTTWSNTCLPRAGMEMLQGWKEWAFSANLKDIDLVEN